jgi:hypothetical protein
MLGAYMLSENFLRIDSLALPNFQWSRWVGVTAQKIPFLDLFVLFLLCIMMHFHLHVFVK